MSGIAALFGTNNDTAVRDMLSRIKHRGPETTGVSAGTKAVLGVTARNLGDSFYARNGSAIVLDGPAGRKWTPGGLLAALNERGPDALAAVDGAFAVAAQTRNGFLAARDRFGLKPLYCGTADGQMFFASELKALPASCRHFSPIAPGSYCIGGHEFTTREYQAFAEGHNSDERRPATPAEAACVLRRLLETAVNRLLPNGRSVGVFLSGGLDSSIIAALTTRLAGPVQTFAAGYQGSPDLEHARTVARYLGTEHRDYCFSRQEMLAVLPEVIYHLESFDWSLVRSAVANYFVAALAREHGADFVLVGEGADELFGGYHYLKEKSAADQTRELQHLLRAGHNIGFQRVDRMTAAHSLDCAMPFMDRDVVRYAAALPAEWKIHGPNQVEKWILRRAVTGDLPEAIVWRRKDEFSQGSGAAAVMADLAAGAISDDEFAREREPFPGCVLHSKEELYYYRIFREFFPGRAAFESVGRWRPF